MNKDFELVTGTKKIDYQGTDCYLPVLIVKTKLPDAKNRTIKMVHISTGNPLVFRKDALKYANIWRNESLQAGYITHF